MKGRTTLIFFFCCCMLSFQTLLLKAQELKVTGKVIAKSDGMPMPGVTITLKGTQRGTASGPDGTFSIQIPKSGAILVFSLIGMKTQTLSINNTNPLVVSMEDDVSSLNEVVVVGYGTQKKSVVTGAISSVKAADLENQQITRVEDALQGRTTGLTMAHSSGSPGASSTIQIRGVTTLNNNNPLFVVDGIVVDNGGIDYLNSSDIESIEVLKDAASAAIYGARAAAGVILVTTKKGSEGAVRLNYNAYVGNQAPARKLDLLNATQYATLRNEASVNGGGSVIFPNPTSLGTGTDWQSAIFNNHAMIQDHEVSLSGGNKVSKFYGSFGYLDQQGIVASDISYYKRYNVRLNSSHKIKDWLTIGNTLGYSHIKNQGITSNSEFGGPLSSAINLDPLTPIIETDPTKISKSPYTQPNVLTDASGFPYGQSSNVGQEMINPLAYIQTQLGNYGWSDNIVGSVYGEIKPIKGLTIRSNLSGKLAYWGGESFRPLYYLNPTNISSSTFLSRNKNQGVNWNLENTATYSKKIGKHDFTILLGAGAYSDNNTTGVNINFQGVPARNFNEATFNIKVTPDLVTANAYDGVEHRVSSLFSRITYNYDEKYLFNALLRRDGSSRFGANNKYGYFPSASIGWVASNENFWPKNDYVNSLKIRSSYGVTGSDNIGNFLYLSTVGGGRNYVFGIDNLAIGWSPDAPANPDLKWEQTSQLDIGLDANLFKYFTLGFDWYNKKTTGILRPVSLPGYGGFSGSPTANVADMANKGVEFELGFHKKVGQLNIGVNGNLSHNKNVVTYLGTGINFISSGGGIQNLSTLQRTEVGYSYNYFYGYQTNGIFQNQSEVNAYTGPKGLIQPSAKPGDFRFVDLNGDGVITSADRTFLGNAIPTLNYGLNLNIGYKAFDFQIFGQGVGGNKIFQGLRRLDIGNANWTTQALNRWTGEGTSNTYPKLSTSDPNGNFNKLSNLYLENGAYFRIRTLQLGYTLPHALVSKISLQKVRIYLNASNLFTFTKYTGYDPEIGGGPDVWGIDAGVYPQARTFSFGLNVGL